MNGLTFSAEASLYKSYRRYRTAARSAGETTWPSGTVRAAAIMNEDVFVFGCRPGLLELGEGENMTCVNPEDPWGSGGSGPGIPDPNDGDGPVRGSRPTRPRPRGNRPSAAKIKRCRACKKIGDACRAEALLAGQTCADNAAAMARGFCRADFRHSPGTTPAQGWNALSGVTAWGCTVSDLQDGNCPQAEGKWADPARWQYGCTNLPYPATQCTGPGLQSCLDSWRLSHPSGETSQGSSGTSSASFKGMIGDVLEGTIGGETGETLEHDYTWNGRTGYGKVCTLVASDLSHKCTGAQNRCQMDNDCTAEDLADESG